MYTCLACFPFRVFAQNFPTRAAAYDFPRFVSAACFLSVRYFPVLCTSFTRFHPSWSSFHVTVESNYVRGRLLIGVKIPRQFFSQWEAKTKTNCTFYAARLVKLGHSHLKTAQSLPCFITAIENFLTFAVMSSMSFVLKFGEISVLF